MHAIVSHIESDDNLELKDFGLDGFKPLDILEVIPSGKEECNSTFKTVDKI